MDDSPSPAESSESSTSVNRDRFPVVGMGASAGGLEAFEKFFTGMPADSGMAFVLVSHLDPDRKSMLGELLQRRTRMPVLEAQEGAVVQPNHVYVTPPNRYLTIEKRALRLAVPQETRGMRMAVDHFLRSLAHDQGEHAIGIILSGNGSDGTLGVRTLNGAGGIALVQDPATARYEGMPRNAIATGLADYVLPVEQMPETLISYAAQFYPRRARMPASKAGEALSPLEQIFNLLRSGTGHDFSQYKRNTIQRRIERRMSIHNIDEPDQYVRFLQENAEEIQVLFKELLIGVTSFFRDPAAFEVFKQVVLPGLLQDKPDQAPVRIWVPGCATGEEAYSLAMIVQESMEKEGRNFRVQIFATDLSEESIEYARTGHYPGSIALDMSPERLRRFFIKSDEGYQVKKEIRESIVFAVHNVIKDAPFTKLDLVSCRNLLIYFQLELQNRLYPLFHYSLRPGGVLFLGTSESVAGFVDLFLTLDKKWKFFQRKGASPASLPPFFEHSARTTGPRLHQESPPAVGKSQEANWLDDTRKMLLEGFAPPCVLINSQGDILFVHGPARKYLGPDQGRISTMLTDMVRDELKLEIRTALNYIATQAKEYTSHLIEISMEGRIHPVRITFKPYGEPSLWWVLFEEEKPRSRKAPLPSKGSSRGGKRVAQLEQELHKIRQNLQATIEEHQASDEELRSMNEELQSTNEELQSTNEELETSKEELQSLNEELVAVNGELSSKVEQFAKVENDMRNLLDSLKIGIIFLDAELRIKRFTTEATRLVSLIPTDVGRPLSHLVSNLDYEDLLNSAKAVLDTLVPKELQIQTKASEWYLMRIMPYRTVENVIDGLVLTFDNIHPIKAEAAKVAATDEAARIYAEGIIQTIREPFLVLDAQLRVSTVNKAFCRKFQMQPEHAANHLIYQLGNGQWDLPALRTLLEEVITLNKEVEDFVVEGAFGNVGWRKLLLNARRIQHEGKQMDFIFLAMEEVPIR